MLSSTSPPFFSEYLSENDVVVLPPIIEVLKTNKGGILYNRKRESLTFLTQTQAYVCSLCDGSLSVREIAQKVSEIYNVDFNIVLDDVLFFLKFLIKSNALIVLPNKISLKLDSKENFLYEVDEKTDAVLSERITTIGINLIDQCPLKCIYCFANSSPRKMGKLSADEAIEILTRGRELGAEGTYLGGGEPLLHEEISNIIEKTYKLGYKTIEISTKATNVDYEKAKSLRDAGLREIQVSVDSRRPNVYEKIVGTKNTYSKMLAGIYYLLKAGLNVHIRATLTRYNVEEIVPMVKFFYKFGIRQFRIASVTPIGRATLNLVPLPKELIWLEQNLEKLRKEYSDLQVKLAYDRIGNVNNCGGCFVSLFVHTNGDVTFCDVAGELRYKYPILNIGNIKEQSLKEILHSEKVVKLQRIRTNNDACRTCPKRYQCRGGCVVRTCAFFNTPYLPDPLCEKVYGTRFGEMGKIFPWTQAAKGAQKWNI